MGQDPGFWAPPPPPWYGLGFKPLILLIFNAFLTLEDYCEERGVPAALFESTVSHIALRWFVFSLIREGARHIYTICAGI